MIFSTHLDGFACLDAQAHGKVFELFLEASNAELQHLLALVRAHRSHFGRSSLRRSNCPVQFVHSKYIVDDSPVAGV